MLSLALGAAGLLIALFKFFYEKFWSPSAKLQRVQDWILTRQAILKAEKDRQKDTEAKIDARPPKTGDDLIDDLNKKFPGGKV